MPELRPYQRDAVARVMDGISYLALDAGLGKTAISLAVAREINARRVLIFCPATVRLIWDKEAAKWWPDCPPVEIVNGRITSTGDAILVVNYDKVSLRNGALDYVEEIKRFVRENGRFDLLILDEAHALKNARANRTAAVFEEIKPLCERVVALSGTPAPNHAGELYAPISALAPELLLRPNGTVMSQIGFENRYCEVEERRIGGGRTVRQIVGSKNLGELRGLLQSFMFRRTKAQVLKELPPLQFVERFTECSCQGLRSVTGYEELISSKLSDEEFLSILRNGDEHVARLRRMIGLAKVEPCGEFILSEMLDNRRKAVVWAEHRNVIDELTRKLAVLGPVRIDGRDDLKARGLAVQRFLENPSTRILIGNIKAASTGLTLVGDRFPCSDAYFVEASYTPGDNYQSACRLHRIGQRDAVLAHMFVASGTIDERVMKILTRKTNDLAALFQEEEVA